MVPLKPDDKTVIVVDPAGWGGGGGGWLRAPPVSPTQIHIRH